MKLGDIRVKGLTQEEIKRALESEVRSKNRSFQDVIEDMKESVLLLMELDPGDVEQILELIKKCYPKLLKDI